MLSHRAARLDVMVLSGTCDGDPSAAIAASRTAAVGVLDLTYAPDPAAAMESLRRLGRAARGEVGVKLDLTREDVTVDVLTDLPAVVRHVVLVPAGRRGLVEHVERFRSRSLRVLVEAISLDEAEWCDSCGVDGIVAKGCEAGGRVGDASTFILLQQLVEAALPSVWAHGGVGRHSAAGCRVAGATGVVLDSQTFFADDARPSVSIRAAVERLDGSETVCVSGAGESFRCHATPKSGAFRDLTDYSERLLHSDGAAHAALSGDIAAWRAAVRSAINWSAPNLGVLPIGQDIGEASRLARRYPNVAAIVHGIADSSTDHILTANRVRPLCEGSRLARSHRIRFPIVQGPMTRVSDRAAFAKHVADEGALPFLALALMRRKDADTLLAETSAALGERPWGVGILGFVPPELRSEQLEVIAQHRPSCAIIAGGRPDQAFYLEQRSIPTYLHVPSPGLLELFLSQGARRFVFEGRECGGHVGPRTSYVLWNTMVELLEERLSPAEMADCHVLLAGGIHDARSAAVGAAIAAPLAAAGAAVGVLVGTAYVFTEEAVSSGAIVRGFQQEALSCTRTALLESGPGHATRCAETTFASTFREERRRLTGEGHDVQETREVLEDLNLGRLRLASKGLERHDGGDNSVTLNAVDEIDQHARGMYMMGDVATVRTSVVPMAELHDSLSRGAAECLSTVAAVEPVPPDTATDDVVIIGMSCVLPGAPDLATYWRNIIRGVDAVREVPSERWDWRRYFDADPNAPDRVYSRWGGFVDEVAFDPTRWGIPPAAIPSIEPLQLLALHVADAALSDSGYDARPFPRQRASVILGVGGGIAELGQQYVVRSWLPSLMAAVPDGLLDQLPEWTEDSFPGILLNVAAGRVANRLDFGGVNYTVDAACASSLAAVYLGAQELQAGTSDLVIVGGADTVQNAFAYLCFSKTHALSPGGRCRPFDDSADGIAISEGVAMIVLKRRSDAERDGDRIYAVLKGIAGSSDGRAKGLTAPRPEGQALALERAYARATFTPATVGLIEAHGTGTVAGDQAETQTLTKVFTAAGAAPQSCALGSVKSMIGHTKCAAGIAGLIKAALSLYHHVLPPTLNIDTPNSKAGFDEGPFYLNTELRPWIGHATSPRRAGVSAFGFGGTNFHGVMEEHVRPDSLPRPAPVTSWPAELVAVSGSSRPALASVVRRLRAELDAGAAPSLPELARAVWDADAGERVRLAVVAASLDELRVRLRDAEDFLGGSSDDAPQGLHYTVRPMAVDGTMAFVFPGQGSQYPDMLRELAVHFEEIPASLRRADTVLADRGSEPVSTQVFPPPRFSRRQAEACETELARADVAQPALGAIECGVLDLLSELGVRADAVAGHSYGEYVALCAAGVISPDGLSAVSQARGQAFIRAVEERDGGDPGTMAAVTATPERVAAVVASIDDVWIANTNSPQQTVLSGATEAMRAAVELLRDQRLSVHPLRVACAFHTPLVAGAKELFSAVLSEIDVHPAAITVYSNTTARRYPTGEEAVIGRLLEHITSPVCFSDQVANMYADGVRIFLEVGPRAVLTGLIKECLAGRPVLAIAIDSGKGGIRTFLEVLGELWAHGVAMNLDRLYVSRAGRLDLDALAETRPVPLSPATWLVNGGAARPLNNSNEAPTRGGEPRIPGGPDVQADPEVTHLGRPPQVVASESARNDPREIDNGTRAIPHVGTNDSDAVILGFQRLMTSFLDTQQRVMESYLRGPQNGPVSTSAWQAGDPVPGTSTGPDVHFPRVETRPVVDVSAPVLPVSTPETTPEMTRDEITSRLIGIVSERTGYPPEVLAPEIDLEAELGVDSVKRVEIIGTLLDTFGAMASEATEAFDRLVTSRTLLEIVDNLLLALGTEQDRCMAPRPDSDDGTPVTLGSEVARFEIEAAPTSAPPASALAPSGAVLITDDGRGVARDVVNILRSHGVTARLIRSPIEPDDLAEDTDVVDFTNTEAAARYVDEVRRRDGSIGGIVHLGALAPGDDVLTLDAVSWQTRVSRDVRSLHKLARAAASDLKRSQPVSWLIAATQLGGTFGFDCIPASVVPTGGGVAGLVKSLAAEWPGAHARVVDFDAGADPSVIATQIVAEAFAVDSEREVGYRDGQRYVMRYRPASTDGLMAEPPLDSESVVLVTGGARGITAAVTRDLAAKYRPRLVIVGRSPWPQPEEPATIGITDAVDIKRMLIETVRARGHDVIPKEVEDRYRELVHSREMVANLEAMRSAGASVTYRQVDVRDPESLIEVVRAIHREHGRLDGVLHGAGVIEDRLIEDKSDESFDAVFDTKVTSAFTLQQVLQDVGVRFVVLFSSVSGRFGNSGQSDYAAANETMSKLGLAMARRTGANVVVLHWGPWRHGMVTPEIERILAARGVQILEPDDAKCVVDEELRRLQGPFVELVVGDGPWRGQEAERTQVVSQSAPLGPLLGRRQIHDDGTLSYEVELDPISHPYLDDHQLDEKAVVPAGMALEIITEAAASVRPAWEVTEVINLEVVRGIVLENGAETVHVACEPVLGTVDSESVRVAIRGRGDSSPVHYRAAVTLQPQLSRPETRNGDTVGGGPFPMPIDEAYDRWLFHGPSLRAIRAIEEFGATGLVARLEPSTVLQCLNRGGTWIIDPVAIDAVAQLVILWARASNDVTALPTRIGRYRRYGPLDIPTRCVLLIREQTRSSIVADAWFVDDVGNCRGVLEGFAGAISAGFNRLAGSTHLTTRSK